MASAPVDRVAVVAAADPVVAWGAAAESGGGLGEVAGLVVAEDLIGTVVARDRVAAAVAVEDVVGPAAGESVVRLAAEEPVFAVAASRAAAVAMQGVGAGGTGDLVVAGSAVAEDGDRGRQIGREDNDVVVGPGVEEDRVDAGGVVAEAHLVVGNLAVAVAVFPAGVVGPHDDLAGGGVVVDLELLGLVAGLAGQNEPGPRAHVEHERLRHAGGQRLVGRAGVVVVVVGAAHDGRERRLHRRAGDQVPLQEPHIEQLDALLPERDEADERHRDANLD